MDIDFILSADNKFIFISCCFELKRFILFEQNTDLSVFNSYLPVQLDGTCNGFQHLSLLSEEVELFEQLNLSESNRDDDPKDFYTFMLDKMKSYMLSRILKNKDLSTDEISRINRLTKININRSHIKNLIMTKPYNATDYTVVNNLVDSLSLKGVAILTTKTKELKLNPSEEEVEEVNLLQKDDSPEPGGLENLLQFDDLIQKGCKPKKIKNSGKEKRIVNLYYPDPESEDFVTRDDLRYFVDIFNTVLFQSYPHIKLLIVYLKKIASIFNDLNLPIVWRLPTGLEVSQMYILLKIKKIEPYGFSKRTLNLTMSDKTKINKFKQKNALMPNLVHSLDSTALFMLYNIFKYSNKNMNFYSVHDCFGVSPKHVDLLVNILRGVYIELYSNNKYIERFDQDIVDTIKKTLVNKQQNSEIKYDSEKRLFYTNDIELIKLPKIPINKDILSEDKIKYYNKLNKSILLIN